MAGSPATCLTRILALENEDNLMRCPAEGPGVGHGPRRPLWNRVHVVNEESILSEITEQEKKLRVKSFQFSSPGHCAPWCSVIQPSTIHLYSVCPGHQALESAGVGQGPLGLTDRGLR